jgi:hypothetical protein
LNELAVLDDDALNAVINASQGIAGDLQFHQRVFEGAALE